MERIYLHFDEFFKIAMKAFLRAFGFGVETEFEILKLPKRVDVLVIKRAGTVIPPEFRLFRYFAEHNLISFKSPKDPIRERDIVNAVIYLHGYMNLTKGADYGNTTMAILCNHTPRRYLKRHASHVSRHSEGVWVIRFGLFDIRLINLNCIPVDGLDGAFVKDFAGTEAFRESIVVQQNARIPKKVMDMLSDFMYIRAGNFEQSEFKELAMPLVMKADITSIAEPYYNRGLDDGKKEGRKEGRKEGKKEGKKEEKLQTARRMLEKGFDLDDVMEITGLSRADLKKAKLISG